MPREYDNPDYDPLDDEALDWWGHRINPDEDAMTAARDSEIEEEIRNGH